MKFKLIAAAMSNCTYKREEIYEDDMTQKEWDELSEEEQNEFLDELAVNFVWDDIECNASPI